MAAAVLGLPSSAGAATIHVTSTANASSSVCTLRSAIKAANTNAASGGCSAGHGTDAIRISKTGTINLQSALPQITSKMSIAGPSSDPTALEVTRLSGGFYRIFDIAAGAEVTISGLSASQGHISAFNAEGGGILNAGDLTLTNVALHDNAAEDTESTHAASATGGAIASESGATLTVSGSRFVDNSASSTTTAAGAPNYAITNGGAIYNEGTMSIDRTTFHQNSSSATADFGSSAYGGAIVTTGPTTIALSTLDQNSVTAIGTNATTLSFGGAVYHSGSSTEATIALDRDTITANTSTATSTGDPNNGVGRSGGLWLSNASASIMSSTIDANTVTASNPTGALGANVIFNTLGGTLTFKNTIVADPIGDVNCETDNGTTQSLGFNLEDDADAVSQCHFTTSTDLSNTGPQLGSLADNGAATQTMSLPTTSPAVDAGFSTGGSTDQRGDPRPRDLIGLSNESGSDGSDMGAFELQTTESAPQSIGFGSQPLGTSSQARTLTITNGTTSTVTLGTLSLTGTDANAFSLSNDTCSSAALAGAASCTVDVTFGPSGTIGHKGAAVHIPDNAANALDVAIGGTATDVTPPDTQITSANVNKAKRKATFKFKGTDDVSTPSQLTFKCSLDSKKFRGCDSPETYKHLKPGKHTFKVKARDGSGNTDPHPATKTFKIPR